MTLTGEGWGKQSLGYFFQEVHIDVNVNEYLSQALANI